MNNEKGLQQSSKRLIKESGEAASFSYSAPVGHPSRQQVPRRQGQVGVAVVGCVGVRAHGGRARVWAASVVPALQLLWSWNQTSRDLSWCIPTGSFVNAVPEGHQGRQAAFPQLNQGWGQCQQQCTSWAYTVGFRWHHRAQAPVTAPAEEDSTAPPPAGMLHPIYLIPRSETEGFHSSNHGLPWYSSAGKEPACNAGDPAQFVGWEDPLEKG